MKNAKKYRPGLATWGGQIIAFRGRFRELRDVAETLGLDVKAVVRGIRNGKFPE